MKIVLLILLSVCTILKAEYPRYNIRKPPAQYHYRIPPSKQFAKKWHQPPRGVPQPIRSRPPSSIPVHMPLAHKIPMGMSSVSPRPISPPVRTFWKNTQNQIKFPIIEKPQQLPQQLIKKKPFISTPNLPLPEYDYHIQTNNIPNGPVNTIKQVGDKGPIHTIPAPNLSLRDKPNVVNEVRKEINYPQTTSYIQVDPSHHYQVTEPPESGQAKLFRAQQQKLQLLQQQQFQQHQLQQQKLYQQQQQYQILQQQKQQEKLQQIQQQYQQQLLQQQFKKQTPIEHFQQQSQVSEVQVQPQQIYLAEETAEIQPELLQQGQIQGDIISSNNQLSQKDLYHLLGGSYPQSVVPDGLLQSVKIQSESDFPHENMYQTNQDFDLNAESTINANPSSINFKPEFQSFNYDEQAHQASQKDLMKKKFSSLVTATYTLSPGNIFERHGQVVSEDAPHKQFESRSDLGNNGVSEETTEKREDKDEKTEEKILETPYYSSLPNKEAADRLADLQAAGKINHNLMELSKSNDDMALFISKEKEENTDENENDSSQSYSENSKEQNIDYDEYGQEENQNIDSAEQNSKEFGTRIRPKTNN